MHRSLNENIKELNDSILEDESDKLAMQRCRSESSRTLQRLLFTDYRPSTDYPEYAVDLATTASLALRIKASSEREQLLQGVLYRILLDIDFGYSRRQVAPSARQAALQQGIVIGPVLASALRLYLWLHSSVDTAEAWADFSGFIWLLIGGKATPSELLVKPAAWDRVVEVAGVGDFVDGNIMAACMLWLAARVDGMGKIDGSRLTSWFVEYMREQGRVKVEMEESAGIWSAADGKAAGVLFLRAWETMTDAGSESSPVLPPVNCTSPEAIEAFASWLSTYDWKETVAIK